jgi:hypothetical protein
MTVISVFQTEAATFLSSSSSVVLTRLSGSRSRPTTSQKIWQRRESIPDPWNSDRWTTEAIHLGYQTRTFKSSTSHLLRYDCEIYEPITGRRADCENVECKENPGRKHEPGSWNSDGTALSALKRRVLLSHYYVGSAWSACTETGNTRGRCHSMEPWELNYTASVKERPFCRWSCIKVSFSEWRKKQKVVFVGTWRCWIG